MRPHAIDPYTLGFTVAEAEIRAGIASFVQARERGLFPGDQDSRIEWDSGYNDCVCAFRLGHDVEDMVRTGCHGPSLVKTATLVQALLDGAWENEIRPDPRR